MIGHRAIIDLRRRGARPAAVYLVVGPAPSWNPEGELAAGAIPAVYTEDTPIEAADLRFLLGLRVHVNHAEGCNTEAWWRWWEAVTKAGPSKAYGIDPETGEVVTWPK